MATARAAPTRTFSRGAYRAPRAHSATARALAKAPKSHVLRVPTTGSPRKGAWRHASLAPPQGTFARLVVPHRKCALPATAARGRAREERSSFHAWRGPTLPGGRSSACCALQAATSRESCRGVARHAPRDTFALRDLKPRRLASLGADAPQILPCLPLAPQAPSPQRHSLCRAHLAPWALPRKGGVTALRQPATSLYPLSSRRRRQRRPHQSQQPLPPTIPRNQLPRPSPSPSHPPPLRPPSQPPPQPPPGPPSVSWSLSRDSAASPTLSAATMLCSRAWSRSRGSSLRLARLCECAQGRPFAETTRLTRGMRGREERGASDKENPPPR